VIGSYPARPAALQDIRTLIRRRGVEATLGPERAGELALAVSEACANSIRHSASREIRLEWRQSGNCVVVEVEDDGVFKERLPVPELEAASGRGILLMTAFVDEIAIREGTTQSPGTTVRLVKCKRR
jgi:anti-sigma regulatory factor (Ser/Thr protein kinase)